MFSSEHRGKLRIIQGASWVPESVWTWAEILDPTCIGNLEMKNDAICNSPKCQVGYFIWPAAFF